MTIYERKTERHLREIRNGIAWLIKATAFRTRNAWDGLPWEERERLAAEEEKEINVAIRKMMEAPPWESK